jgi:predicted dehydrogenase
MRVAVLGTGVAGRSNLLDLLTHPRFEVVALVGRRPDRTRQIAEQFAIETVYGSAAELLQGKEEVEAVVVAAPPAVAPSLVRTVLDRGCAVLVDKPAGAAAIDLAWSAAHSQWPVVVGYNRRYQSHVRHCRDLLAASAPPEQVLCLWRGPFTDRYRNPSTYRHTAAFGHGVLLDTASHILDTLVFLGLAPLTVTAARLRPGGIAGADVEADILLRFVGTTRVHIGIRDQDVDADSWSMQITGRDGHLELTREALTGCWRDHPVALAAGDVCRPVDDLLALADGAPVHGASLAEAAAVLEVIDQARRQASVTGLRHWQRPRAKALGRLNGAC